MKLRDINQLRMAMNRSMSIFYALRLLSVGASRSRPNVHTNNSAYLAWPTRPANSEPRSGSIYRGGFEGYTEQNEPNIEAHDTFVKLPAGGLLPIPCHSLISVKRQHYTYMVMIYLTLIRPLATTNTVLGGGFAHLSFT